MKRPHRPAPDDQPLHREIRQAMVDDGRTSYALARDAGVDESAVRRFASRERSLSLDSADRLCSTLGLKLIRKGSNRPKPRPDSAPLPSCYPEGTGSPPPTGILEIVGGDIGLWNALR